MPRKNSSSSIGAITSAYSDGDRDADRGQVGGDLLGRLRLVSPRRPRAAGEERRRRTNTITGYSPRPNPTAARISRHHVPAAGNPSTCRQPRWDVESHSHQHADGDQRGRPATPTMFARSSSVDHREDRQRREPADQERQDVDAERLEPAPGRRGADRTGRVGAAGARGRRRRRVQPVRTRRDLRLGCSWSPIFPLRREERHARAAPPRPSPNANPAAAGPESFTTYATIAGEDRDDGSRPARPASARRPGATRPGGRSTARRSTIGQAEDRDQRERVPRDEVEPDLEPVPELLDDAPRSRPRCSSNLVTWVSTGEIAWADEDQRGAEHA